MRQAVKIALAFLFMLAVAQAKESSSESSESEESSSSETQGVKEVASQIKEINKELAKKYNGILTYLKTKEKELKAQESAAKTDANAKYDSEIKLMKEQYKAQKKDESEKIPIRAEDDSWSGYFWSFFGYPIQHELDNTNPLTQYYLKEKKTAVKVDENGKLYISVNMNESN